MTRPIHADDEEEPEEEDELGEEEIEKHAFPKVEAAVQDAEDSRFLYLLAIGDALIEEIGPPGKNRKNNGSQAKLEACSKRLRDQGHDKYTAGYLADLREVAHAFDAALRQEAEEAAVPFTVLYRMRINPHALRSLLACLNGKHPAELSGKTTTFRGETMPLARAIRRRGRILVADAEIALGHKSGSPQRATHDDDGSTVPDRTAEDEIKIAARVMANPAQAYMVMEDRDALNGAYIAATEAKEKEREERTPQVREESRPRGDLALQRVRNDAADTKMSADKLCDDLDAVEEPLGDGLLDFVLTSAHDIRTALARAEKRAKEGPSFSRLTIVKGAEQ